eukprot:5659227-Ditylum_brightwellii.AAC.1
MLVRKEELVLELTTGQAQVKTTGGKDVDKWKEENSLPPEGANSPVANSTSSLGTTNLVITQVG